MATMEREQNRETPFGCLLVDAYDDPDYTEKVASVYPDMVKSTQRLSKDELAAVPDRLFGVVIYDRTGAMYRKFPLVDPGHIWLAAKHWAECDGVVPDAVRKTAACFILDAADLHGLSFELPHRDELERARNALAALPTHNVVNLSAAGTRMSEITRDDEPIFRHSLYKTAEDGQEVFALPREQRYPIHTKSLLKTAMEWFGRHERDIEPADRFIMAGNMVKQAEALEVDPDARLVKYAKLGFHDHSSLHVRHRMRFATREGFPEHGEQALSKIASMIDDQAERPEVLMQALVRFDKVAGLQRFWGRTIADPAEIFAAGMPKEAGAEDFLARVDGEIFTNAQLEGLCVEKTAEVERLYGKAALEKLATPGDGAEFFRALPVQHQRQLVKLAKDKKGKGAVFSPEGAAVAGSAATGAVAGGTVGATVGHEAGTRVGGAVAKRKAREIDQMARPMKERLARERLTALADLDAAKSYSKEVDALTSGNDALSDMSRSMKREARRDQRLAAGEARAASGRYSGFLDDVFTSQYRAGKSAVGTARKWGGRVGAVGLGAGTALGAAALAKKLMSGKGNEKTAEEKKEVTGKQLAGEVAKGVAVGAGTSAAGLGLGLAAADAYSPGGKESLEEAGRRMGRRAGNWAARKSRTRRGHLQQAAGHREGAVAAKKKAIDSGYDAVLEGRKAARSTAATIRDAIPNSIWGDTAAGGNTGVNRLQDAKDSLFRGREKMVHMADGVKEVVEHKSAQGAHQSVARQTRQGLQELGERAGRAGGKAVYRIGRAAPYALAAAGTYAGVKTVKGIKGIIDARKQQLQKEEGLPKQGEAVRAPGFGEMVGVGAGVGGSAAAGARGGAVLAEKLLGSGARRGGAVAGGVSATLAAGALMRDMLGRDD